jgi:hypothetical protein
MEVAAFKGYLHLCEYLREEGCTWSRDLCSGAVSRRYLVALRWLHEHGCPWDFRALCKLAAQRDSVEIMMYLQQQSDATEWNAALLTDMLNAAGAYKKLAAAQWLRQQGAEWPPMLRLHSRSWSGDVLQWARAEGCASPV